MTTWKARIANIPVVLDSIYKQMLLPDKVVINLAYSEEIPPIVQDYITKHGVEVFRTKDTKVYKKLIPTLLRYPDACVINIDDDFIYPSEMIADFMDMHRKYPNHPVSGNRYLMGGMVSHCGCASLTKLEYFGDYLHYVDDNFINNCPSSDVAFTYFAALSGHPYLESKGLYFTNMQTFNEVNPYSPSFDDGIDRSFRYLTGRFGEMDREQLVKCYVDDPYVASILSRIEKQFIEEFSADTIRNAEASVRSSKAYRLGRFLLHPNRTNFKKLFCKK